MMGWPTICPLKDLSLEEELGHQMFALGFEAVGYSHLWKYGHQVIGHLPGDVNDLQC